MREAQTQPALTTAFMKKARTLLQVETGDSFRLAIFTLGSAVCLLSISIANNASRAGLGWSSLLYWLGLLGLFVPIATRLLMNRTSRSERLYLVLLLGFSFYLVKLFYSPLEVKYADELQHWRTEYQIFTSLHLFTSNQSLPISSNYPALEMITNAFIRLSGLPFFESSAIVIGACRLLSLLALFLFYEQVGKSARVAGVASLIYMTNPNYLFYDSFYIYQVPALALTALGLYLIARSETAVGWEKRADQVLLLLTFGAVVTTHHITSYVFLGLLVAWLLASLWIRRSRPGLPLPVLPVALGVIEITAWVIFVAPDTIDYFSESASGMMDDLARLLHLPGTVIQVFHSPSGPLVDRIFNIGAAGLIALCLLPAAWLAYRRYRKAPLALAMVISSLTYFGSLLVRIFSSQGAELAGRSWSFVFIPAAFTLAFAIWVIRGRWLKQKPWALPALALLLTVLFVGGIMGGWPPYWERQPGPYQVGGFESSIEPEGIAAAQWASRVLGPNNRISADFTNYVLMGTYGLQDPLRGMYQIYYSLDRNPEDIDQIRQFSAWFLEVDLRMSQSLPASGRYFEPNDPHSFKYNQPLDLKALTKFDQWLEVPRLFDSGDLVIYDLRGISDGK